MAAPTFETTDAGYRQLDQALLEQIINMQKSHNTVDDINTSVGGAYIADASTTHQNKVEDWLDTQSGIEKQLSQVQVAFEKAHGLHNDAADLSQEAAAGVRISTQVYNLMQG